MPDGGGAVLAGETRSSSFVVRLRVEQEAGRSWWGEVQHVESGERVAFRDERKLLGFLRHHLYRLRRMPPAHASPPE